MQVHAASASAQGGEALNEEVFTTFCVNEEEISSVLFVNEEEGEEEAVFVCLFACLSVTRGRNTGTVAGIVACGLSGKWVV